VKWAGSVLCTALAFVAFPTLSGMQSNATAPTHWVTPDGSTTSACTATAPCTLARAFALAGVSIAAGSWVNVAPGVYTQPAITVVKGGMAGFPIRFIGAGTSYETGTRLTGTRTPLPAAVWTLCAGSVYTYCTPFDEATSYTVSLVAQRPPVTSWVPIVVDDRQASSGWMPSGRQFTIDEPVRYTSRYSTAAVEAQHCTYWHDTVNNLLRVHPCREQAPSDADNFYAGPSKWGTVTFSSNADYLSFEGVTIEHTSGPGLVLNPGAQGIELDNIKMLSSQLWARGTGTVGTDLLLKQEMAQGVPGVQCYSAQYGGIGLASRSCWNAFGTGYALVIGAENTTTPYNQTFDRVQVERGWNALTISGPNTLNHATVWGFANHAAVSSGARVTVRNSVFLNAQDTWFLADEDWSGHVYEHNLFYGGALFWCGREGSANGAICPALPTGWTFRHNLVASMVTDIMTEPTTLRDCNAWMGRSFTQDLLRISQPDGQTTIDYRTVAAIKFNTASDDNSIGLPSAGWYDGSIFQTFRSQETYPVDLTLTPEGPGLLTACDVVAGPDTLVSVAPVAPRPSTPTFIAILP